jgi:hypothetical protein
VILSAHTPQLRFFSTDARTMALPTDSLNSLNHAFSAWRGLDAERIVQRALQQLHFSKAKAR